MIRSSLSLAKLHRSVSAVTRTALAILFLLCSALAASAQVTEPEASDLARKSILAGLGMDKEPFLDVSPVPVLEQLFAEAAGEGHGSLPFVFHISNQGVEQKGNVKIYHISMDFELEYLVAVSTEGEVYRIQAGRGSLAEFNRLADRYVRLQSEKQAQKYLAWYLTVNPENYALTKIGSPQQLKEEAEREFTGFGKSAGEDKATFEVWWRKHEHEATRLSYGEEVNRTDRGFLVRFYALWRIDPKHVRRGPSISRVSVEFSTNGQVGKLRFKRIRG